MSGIRFLIALVFLFAGLEGELRANASQSPASYTSIPSDIITNLNSKTSVDKMTKTAPDRIQGILAERVIAPGPRFLHRFVFLPKDQLAPVPSADDGFRASGSSPPV